MFLEVKGRHLLAWSQATASNAELSFSIIRVCPGAVTSAYNGNTEKKNHWCFRDAILWVAGAHSLKCCAGRIVLSASHNYRGEH